MKSVTRVSRDGDTPPAHKRRAAGRGHPWRCVWGVLAVMGCGLVSTWTDCGAVRAMAQDEADGSAVEQEDVQDPIVSLRVEGNVTIPAEDILKKVRTRINRPSTPAQIRQDVQALYATKWFVSVEPLFRKTADGLVLVFRVVERPILQKVTFQGNKKIKTKDLEGLTGMKPGGAYDVAINREAARRIESHYHEKGFVFCTVEVAKGNSREDREVVFQITEGPKVHVTSIDFVGNNSFSDPLLKTKIKSSTRKLWLFGGKYDPANLIDDMTAIKDYYHGLGYFDVQVKHKVGFGEDKSQAHISFEIDEGIRYKVRNIEFAGNRVISQTDLQKDLQLKLDDYFTERRLNKDVSKVTNQYGELGRIFAKIDAVPRFLEQPGYVDIVYNIDEDKPYRIRRIEPRIGGEHPHTKESVVINRMTVRPGDLANAAEIKKGEGKLRGSQIFAGANPGNPQGPKMTIQKVDEPTLLNPDSTRLVRGQTDLDEIAHWRATATGPFAPAPQRREHDSQRGGSDIVGADSERANPLQRNDQRPTSPVGRARVQDTGAVLASHRESSSVPRGTQLTAPSRSKVSTSTRSPQDEEPSLPPDLFFRPPAPASAGGSGDRAGAKSPLIRGQSLPEDSPPNPIFENSPFGDPLGRPPSANQPGWVDIYPEVQETQTGRLMFGVGVNSDAGVVGSFVLEENNFDLFRVPGSWQDVTNGTAFRGAGQQFRLEAVPGNRVSRYMVRWVEPYFLDQDVSLGLSGFFFKRLYPDWDEERLGGRISLGHQFTPTVSGAVALRLENVELTNPRTPTPQALQEALGDNFLSTVRVSASHDTRDQPFLAGKGHFVELAFEQGFGDFTFPRIELEARQHYTLYERADGGGRHLFTLSGNLGWTGNDTPIFERFYGGGFSSFRGFAFRGISPRDLDVRVGGFWNAVGTAEFFIPITADDNLGMVAFTDFGTVEEDVAFREFRVSVGAGIRITVPAMGPVPIALDFAVPLMRESFDRKQLISFYVGVLR